MDVKSSGDAPALPPVDVRVLCEPPQLCRTYQCDVPVVVLGTLGLCVCVCVCVVLASSTQLTSLAAEQVRGAERRGLAAAVRRALEDGERAAQHHGGAPRHLVRVGAHALLRGADGGGASAGGGARGERRVFFFLRCYCPPPRCSKRESSAEYHLLFVCGLSTPRSIAVLRVVKESTPVFLSFRPSCVQKPGLTNDSEVSSPSNRRISAYVRVVVLGVLTRAVFWAENSDVCWLGEARRCVCMPEEHTHPNQSKYLSLRPLKRSPW